MRTHYFLILKKPSLAIKPQLSDTYTRERWIEEAYQKNKSVSAKLTRIQVISRLDHYCQKIHQMIPEEVFEWMKKESKNNSEMLTQYAIDFLSQYVKFCQEDHSDIIISRGRNPKANKLNKNNYLHKLHNNSIAGQIHSSRGFMSQVGGIRIHHDDFKRIPIPNTVKKGMYEDEEAEPLTAEQAREVISVVKNQRSITLYNFMNDTGFRIAEAGLVVDSDFDFNVSPPTVKTPNISIKGVLTRGVRYMRSSTAHKVKRLLKDDNNFTFRHSVNQSPLAFRNAEYKKLKEAYDKLGMSKIDPDTGRRNYNLHSWRKRCGTEYARNNNESMSDGYLRHSKYLAQYHIKTKEERIEAFRRAEIDLAIDETEKLKVKTKSLESKEKELDEKTRRIDELEKKYVKPEKFKQKEIEKMKADIIKELSDPNFDSSKILKDIQEKNKKTKRDKFGLPIKE